ncbi:MAG: hypothetical protein RL701_608, partial [Pseudomonadota bacterium]
AVLDCPTLSFERTWPGASGFTKDHYLIIGDGQGHGLDGASRTREYEAIRSFFLAHAVLEQN